MANLRIKDQNTNLLVENGSILTTTDTPTSKFKVADSISQIGTKDGKLCINQGGTTAFNAGVRDMFTVPIDSNGSVTNLQKFLDYLHYTSNADNEVVPDYLLRYKLDGTDSTLTRVGGDDYRIAPACPEAIGSWFDGNQYFTASASDNNAVAVGSGAISISLWVNSISASFQHAISNGLAAVSDNSFRVRTRSSNDIQFGVDGISYNTSAIVSDGKWHHVVFVVSGSGGTIKAYIDNALDFDVAVTTYDIQAVNTLAIGARGDTLGSRWDGGLDEVRIYDRALTADEVTTLYNYRCDFNPSQITTRVWLDPSDISTSNITEAAGLVSLLSNKGTEGNASQGTGTSQPITGTRDINGLNALDYDGTDDYLEIANSGGIEVTTEVSAAYVVQQDTSTNNTHVYSKISGNNNPSISSSFGTDETPRWNVAEVVSSPSVNTSTTNVGTNPSIVFNRFDAVADVQSISVNGATEITDSPGFSTINQDSGVIRIACQKTNQASRFWDGIIGEFIFISSYATDSDKAKIEGYLAWKWGLVSSLPAGHKYKSEPPRI